MREISINDTIGIREFMQKYLCEPYTLEGHITHEKMVKFLTEKGVKLPTRVSMDVITREDIISGKYLLVRAEKKRFDSNNYRSRKTKIIPYINPLKAKEDYFVNQIRRKMEDDYYNNNSVREEAKRKEIRNRILKEMGYVEDEFGEVMTIEEYEMLTMDYQPTEKVNRINKQYAKKMKGR